MVVQLAGADAKSQEMAADAAQAVAILDPSYGTRFYGPTVAAAKKAWELGSIKTINWVYTDKKVRPAPPDANYKKPEMTWIITSNIKEL